MDVTRFAPSPTGYLHEGHAFSALFAARHGGRFLLRIEDIDAGRCRPEFEASTYEDLAWLGLSWELPVRRQSDHLADYSRALDRLKQAGLVYPCFCTRADILRAGGAPQGEEGPIYPGICRHLAQPDLNRPHAWRLDVGKAHRTALYWYDREAGRVEATPQLLGDVVLARKDISTSYHLAVTHDDAFQGVTLVTRGEDLRAATHIHRLLQHLLELPVPDYLFHPLLCDETGKRLAKRDNAPSLREMRQRGVTAEEIRKKYHAET